MMMMLLVTNMVEEKTFAERLHQITAGYVSLFGSLILFPISLFFYSLIHEHTHTSTHTHTYTPTPTRIQTDTLTHMLTFSLSPYVFLSFSPFSLSLSPSLSPFTRLTSLPSPQEHALTHSQMRSHTRTRILSLRQLTKNSQLLFFFNFHLLLSRLPLRTDGLEN